MWTCRRFRARKVRIQASTTARIFSKPVRATSSRATVPLCCVVVRRAYGIAGSAMSNADLFQYRFAWPSGDWGSLPIEGGIEVAYKSEIEAAADPAAHLEAIRARLNLLRSPFRTAEKYGIEDIIDPRDTRPLLCEFAELAWRSLGAV